MTSDSPQKILLVDDEKDFCEVFRSQFEKYGFKVYLAQDESEGFRILLQEQPQCVLLDIRLRGKEDGLTFLRKIRGFRHDELELEQRVRRVPVIILSGAGDNMRPLFQTEGVADYVDKPFDGERLKAKISRAISSSAKS